MTTRWDIVTEARTWETPKTPFAHQGRVKHVGVDCIGLVGGVALALGISGAAEWRSDSSMHNYPSQPNKAMLLAGCDRFLDCIAIDAATLGDVYLMKFGGDPTHFAIISRVDPVYLIHSYAQARRVVENGVNIAGAAIVRAYRFRGIV